MIAKEHPVEADVPLGKDWLAISMRPSQWHTILVQRLSDYLCVSHHTPEEASVEHRRSVPEVNVTHWQNAFSQPTGSQPVGVRFSLLWVEAWLDRGSNSRLVLHRERMTGKAETVSPVIPS